MGCRGRIAQTMVTALLLAVAAVAAAAVATPAHAQPTDGGESDQQEQEELGTDQHDEARRIYDKAKRFFSDGDYVAAAVLFDQAQQIWGRLERGPDGAIIDQDAHAYRGVAISNMASAYAQANMPVEALDAFQQRRELYGAEMSPGDLQLLDDAIARLTAKIGTVTFRGVPDGAELRLDGRLVPAQSLTAPLRLAEGGHSLEVTAEGWKPYLDEFTVVPGEHLPVDVKLAPLETPAKVRIEASVAASQVVIDGKAAGTAPVEVTVAPGAHRYEVTSMSYRDQRGTFEVRPGERTIVKVAMVRRRAPAGLQAASYLLADLAIPQDTPFGTGGFGVGVRLFPEALRWRNVFTGVAFEVHDRPLNQVSFGLVASWCPDSTVWGGGAWSWCPLTGDGHFALGGEVTVYRDLPIDVRGGIAELRATTAIEYHATHLFVRFAAGASVNQYQIVGFSYMPIWGAAAELAIGLEL